MSLPTQTRQWILSSHPTNLPTYSTTDSSANFTLTTRDLPALGANQLLVQTLYLSNDPAQRGWISSAEQIDPSRLYVPPVKLNDPMRARGIAKVLASNHADYAVGDLVLGPTNWSEYAVFDPANPAAGVRKVANIPGLSPTHFLGALGLTGLTAYAGLVEVVGAKAGETVVVSGAAGATGSMVVQIAKKMVGAKKVIGIAGSDDKCRWVESIGADTCLNYKSPNFAADLSAACAGSADVYFDNVGGSILDLMLANMATGGRISACGAITGYNGESPLPMKNYFNVISMRLQIKGFIVLDYAQSFEAIVQKLVGAVKEGTIKIGDENETVVDTKFEEVPKTWLKLFEGGNQGKLVTKL